MSNPEREAVARDEAAPHGDELRSGVPGDDPGAPAGGGEHAVPAPEDDAPPHGDALTEPGAVGDAPAQPETTRDPAAQRDEYLDQLRRLQAEFENYRKRVVKQQTDHLERAAEALVEKLLPVLDVGEDARKHDVEEIEPLLNTLIGVLEKEGLERIAPEGQPFDPNLHEAVEHVPAQEGDPDVGTVVEVLRAGYGWRGRVLRPALVKVKG